MTPYRFLTELTVTAPPAAVYQAIVEPLWVEVWGDATRVERCRQGDATGLGACFDATVRAPIGYTLSARIETVEAQPWRLLRMRATGSVDGSGTWELDGRGDVTDLRFAWSVRTTERWMNLLAPVARPLFERSHGTVVRNAAVAAAAYLDAELLRFDSGPLPV